MKRLLVLAAALALCAAATAQQYKWVDKDGKVRYGDVPPPGVKATPMKPPAAGPAPAAKKDAGKALSPEAAFQKRQKELQEQEQKGAKERAEAETKRVNCEHDPERAAHRDHQRRGRARVPRRRPDREGKRARPALRKRVVQVA